MCANNLRVPRIEPYEHAPRGRLDHTRLEATNRGLLDILTPSKYFLIGGHSPTAPAKKGFLENGQRKSRLIVLVLTGLVIIKQHC